MLYNNFINGFLETLVRRKNPFLCKNVKMCLFLNKVYSDLTIFYYSHVFS